MNEITLKVPSGTKSWKTTLGGCLMSAALGMSQATDETVSMIGKIACLIVPILWALVQKDANVTGGTVPQASSPAAISTKAEEATTLNNSGAK